MSALQGGNAPGHLCNRRWLSKVIARFGVQAKQAEADPTGDAAERMRQASKSCDKEESARPRPTMLPGLTYAGLVAWARRTFGSLDPLRVVARFAIYQGTKEDGSPKYRGIDDGKANGMNAATTTWETLACITFIWPITVARAFIAAYRRLGIRPRALWLGLDDLRHAYRTVPNSQLHFSVVACWHTVRQCVMFYRLPAHSFGYVASVLNFASLPHFVCFVCMTFFAVVVDHFVDDHCVVDLSLIHI